MKQCNPLLVRRGGCGIKKISAKPSSGPQPGWSLAGKRRERPPRPLPQRWLRSICFEVASTPPHEEGTIVIESRPTAGGIKAHRDVPSESGCSAAGKYRSLPGEVVHGSSDHPFHRQGSIDPVPSAGT